MRAWFCDRCVHGVLCLHARGHAPRAGITAVAGFERPGPSGPRRSDRDRGKCSRRTASTGSGFGFQSESCFCELPERGKKSVDGRATLGFTGFRSRRENASVLEDSNCPDSRFDRCGSRRIHRDARSHRKRLSGKGWRQSPTRRRVVIQVLASALIQPSTSFLEFR